MTYNVYQAINFNTYILFIEIYLRRCGYLWSDCEFFLCRFYISVCVARLSSVPGKMESNTSHNHTQYPLFIGIDHLNGIDWKRLSCLLLNVLKAQVNFSFDMFLIICP